MDTEVPIVANTLYQGPIDPKRCVMAPLLLPPGVHNHLLGLGDQVQVVLLAL